MPWFQAGALLLSAYSAYNSNKSRADAGSQAVGVADQNAAVNAQIAAENLAWDKERFGQSMDWAKKIRGEDQLGYGDALKNQTYFDNQLGWQTLLSPRGQQIIDASSRQDILNRTELDRNNREREQRNAQFQRGEQLTASQNKNAYDNVYRQDEAALADLIFAQGQQGRNLQLDANAANNNRIFTRSRNLPAFTDSQSNRAEQGAKSAETARIEAVLRGKTLSRDITNNDLNNASGQYFNFRDKSIQPWQASFTPTTTGNFAPGNVDNSLLTSALGSSVPQRDYIQPNYAGVNQTIANGNATAGYLDTLAGLGGGLYNIYQNNQNTNRQVSADLNTSFSKNPQLF